METLSHMHLFYLTGVQPREYPWEPLSAWGTHTHTHTHIQKCKAIKVYWYKSNHLNKQQDSPHSKIDFWQTLSTHWTLFHQCTHLPCFLFMSLSRWELQEDRELLQLLHSTLIISPQTSSQDLSWKDWLLPLLTHSLQTQLSLMFIPQINSTFFKEHTETSSDAELNSVLCCVTSWNTAISVLDWIVWYIHTLKIKFLKTCKVVVIAAQDKDHVYCKKHDIIHTMLIHDQTYHKLES